jgi:putative (di)nucleoside polyphosphate hydrolase
MALTELARYLPRMNHHNRYLRSGLRSHRHDHDLHGGESIAGHPQVAIDMPPRSLPPDAEPSATK